jgi:hypothetical protein
VSISFSRRSFWSRSCGPDLPIIFGDFDVLNVVEVFIFGSHLVRIAQQRTHQTVFERLKSDNVFAACKDGAPYGDLVSMLRMVSRMTANASCPINNQARRLTLAGLFVSGYPSRISRRNLWLIES